MAAPFDLFLLLIMIGYGLLSGVGIYCLKIGVEKINDFEVTIKNTFRNPIRTLFVFLKVPIIFLGAIFAVSGFLVYQYALNIYDVSIVKPLTNLNLLFIFILGFVLLKEHVTKREVFGIGAMISGVIFVSMYAEDTTTVTNIVNMIIFSIFVIIIGIVFIAIATMKENQKIREYFLAISSGLFFSMGVLFNKAIYEEGFEFGLLSYLYNPYTYLLIVFYFLGLLIEVVAFYGGRLVIVGSVMNLIGVGIPVIGAIFIFNESLLIFFTGNLVFPLSFVKLIGIILILIGTIAIYPRIEKIRTKELIKEGPNKDQ